MDKSDTTPAAGPAETAETATDTRSWHERLKERDPEYYAEVFASFTAEQWEACVAEQERYGIPRRCADPAVYRDIARIAAEPRDEEH